MSDVAVVQMKHTIENYEVHSIFRSIASETLEPMDMP